MNARLISGLLTTAVIGLFMFAPASAFAGNAAEAMSKLKEQSEIKAKSAAKSTKADTASADVGAKDKAKKAVKRMLDKGKKARH